MKWIVWKDDIREDPLSMNIKRIKKRAKRQRGKLWHGMKGCVSFVVAWGHSLIIKLALLGAYINAYHDYLSKIGASKHSCFMWKRNRLIIINLFEIFYLS